MLGLTAFIKMSMSNYNMPSWLFILLIVLVLFAQICALISMSFAAIVKANTYNKKRIQKGLLWFVGFYFASLIGTLILLFILFAITGNLSQFMAATLSQSAFITILIVGLLAYLLSTIVFYFLCSKWFRRGVNVD